MGESILIKFDRQTTNAPSTYPADNSPVRVIQPGTAMQDTEAVVTILSYCFVSALCLVVFFLVDNASSGGPWPTKRTRRTENLCASSR